MWFKSTSTYAKSSSNSDLKLADLGLVQMSLFSCAERNANELEQIILLIYIRFGA